MKAIHYNNRKQICIPDLLIIILNLLLKEKGSEVPIFYVKTKLSFFKEHIFREQRAIEFLHHHHLVQKSGRNLFLNPKRAVN
jgi:hypothetical protein